MAYYYNVEKPDFGAQWDFRKEDASITASGEDFAAYFRGEISVDDLLRKAESEGRAGHLLSVFDRYVHIPLYSSESQ